MPTPRSKDIVDPVVKELDAIKRLLVLLLIKTGTKQGEIATALDIDQGNLSRMMPSRKLKKFEFIDGA